MDSKTILVCWTVGIDLSIRFGGMFAGGFTGYRLNDYMPSQSWENRLSIIGFGCMGFLKPTTTLAASIIALATVRNINYHINKNK
jgi:hypothetical protein